MLTPARIAVAGTVAISGLSFALSFAALTDLADRSGVTWPVAWPLIVDGLIIVATVAVVALRGSAYAWLLLGAGALISIAGNVTHAILPAGPVAAEVAAAVALVPPVALLAVTHLTVMLARNASTARHEQATASDAPLPHLPIAPASPHLPQPARPASVEHEAQAADVVNDVDVSEEADAQPVAMAVASVARTTTPPEARAAAEAFIIDTELSNYAIAARVGVSEASIRRWRKELLANA